MGMMAQQKKYLLSYPNRQSLRLFGRYFAQAPHGLNQPATGFILCRLVCVRMGLFLRSKKDAESVCFSIRQKSKGHDLIVFGFWYYSLLRKERLVKAIPKMTSRSQRVRKSRGVRTQTPDSKRLSANNADCS